MNTYIEKVKSYQELLRLTPDLSLRVTFVVVALCLIGSAFFLGDMYGSRRTATSELQLSGALPFVPYDAMLLERGRGGIKPTGGISSTEKNFVASQNGKIFYPKNCKGVSKIKEENRVWFASVAEAKSNGLVPSKSCVF